MSYERLGDSAARTGKLDDARTWFDKAFVVREALTAADPSNALWQHDLAVSYERLGDATASAGKLDDARTWFDEALAVRKALAAADLVRQRPCGAQDARRGQSWPTRSQGAPHRTGERPRLRDVLRCMVVASSEQRHVAE